MILVTNDDGYNAVGIKELYKNASMIDEAVMVAPDSMRSASGMTITFTRPMRIQSLKNFGINGYSISGYPADTITIAQNVILPGRKIDLVASGINLGSNISLRSIYASGTISAAMAAALKGIKSMAFSMVTDKINANEDSDFSRAGIYSRYIMEECLQNGFPESADVLNINFPENIADNTEIKVVPMASSVFHDYLVHNKDPNGKDYYWLGNEIEIQEDKNTDYYVLMEEKNISVTPLSIHGHNVTNYKPTEKFFERVQERIMENQGGIA
ncbi:5'/3'-nucleotidase SurE [Ferroplasma sp.]|uniref:5'/3'-nucleotidase SurE n=1 Tax=Ferroplasma sp. TaxID=2591003 RepID=UPI002630DFAF|nr:5'/3'-nucleotidase SurE [Ferroplasma sp.]